MHNSAVLLWRPLRFSLTKNPKPQARGPIVMGASIWIKAIRGYLHFLCGSWLFLTCGRRSRLHPPAQGQLRCRLTRGTVKKGSQQGSAPVKPGDGHPHWGLVVGLWFQGSYSNWWDMARQAPWFHSIVPGVVEGCIRMSEAFCYSTLLVSKADDIQLAAHPNPITKMDIQVWNWLYSLFFCKLNKQQNKRNLHTTNTATSSSHG